jgi:hypothetical protein
VKFSVSIPVLDASSPRLTQTLASIYGQSALQVSGVAAEVFIVTPNPGQLGSNASLISMNRHTPTHLLADEGRGLYAALAQSFPLHSGQVHSYLGAGDTYEPQAFTVVSELVEARNGSQSAWITGMIAARREDGAIVRTTLPARYHSKGFARGRYGRLAPSIQQESTWWTDQLHRSIPLDLLAKFRLAGDYFLWQHFADFSEPLVLECVLGSFRWHGDNMSGDWESYTQEMNSMCPAPGLVDKIRSFAYRAQWALPNRWKIRTGNGQVLRWDWPNGPWKSSAS